MSFCETVQGRRPSAVSTVQKHLRGRIIWWTTSGSTRVSHRTSASIAPNPSRGRNIWPITCVNIQANRHIDATSAQNHLLVRSTWRIMYESTLANLRTDVNFVRGRSLGKNTSIIISVNIPEILRIVVMCVRNHLRERYVVFLQRNRITRLLFIAFPSTLGL